tara:strand:- start:186 stop:557 length:372 start_codon:yes stop_codon:yes gene_type:complete
MEFNKKLDKIVEEITDLLKSKNQSYGNSALKPSNIFSEADPIDSLCARIDDKLMRIKNKGINDKTEDTIHDLIGYLFLLLMAMEQVKEKEYNMYKETIEQGGAVSMSGTPVSTMEHLDTYFKK